MYIGMPGLSARAKADPKGPGDLRRMVEFCRLYGVRVSVAFNILIFENELERLIPSVYELLDMGPDAIIVQDPGLALLIRKIAPRQTLHASTQFTITSAEAVQMTADIDFKRIILGRELTLAQISRVRRSVPHELEVFVHGAMCVSFSGQCLASYAWGGRSANRGECAQPCRQRYSLICDGKKIDLAAQRFLLSPRDLCCLGRLNSVERSGAHFLKIEGRLKSAEYTAAAVQAYCTGDASAQSAERLAILYSRDFSTGWLDNERDARFVNALYSSHHGPKIGEIRRVGSNDLIVGSSHPLRPGDGLVFCGFADDFEAGARVYRAVQGTAKDIWRVSFSKNFSLTSLRPGMPVFLNSSPSLERLCAEAYRDKQRHKKIPLRAELTGRAGGRLVLEMRDPQGNRARAESVAPMSAATRVPFKADLVRRELAALSGTCFSLEELALNLQEGLFIPNRELKKMRQTAAARLTQLRISPPGPAARHPRQEVQKWLAQKHSAGPSEQEDLPPKAQLSVLVRDLSQLRALRGQPLGTVYSDCRDIKQLSECLQETRRLGFKAGIVTPRVFKPGEQKITKKLMDLRPDAALVRNLGSLYYLRHAGIELIGDGSLNAANALTWKWLLGKGLKRLAPACEATDDALAAIAAKVPASSVEVVIYQHLPCFHTQFCLQRAYLAHITDRKSCSALCARRRLHLENGRGERLAVMSDPACRATIFDARPRSLISSLPSYWAAGIRHYRIEALEESPSQIVAVLRKISGKLE